MYSNFKSMISDNIFLDPAGGEHVKPDDVTASWRPSVYGLIRNETGDVLMIKPGWNDQWELPGGGLNLGEDLIDALKRECFEETGYRVEPISKLPIQLRQSRMHLRKSGMYVHTICFYYSMSILDVPRDASMINQEIKDEVIDMQWVPLSNCNQTSCHPVAWWVLQTFK